MTSEMSRRNFVKMAGVGAAGGVACAILNGGTIVEAVNFATETATTEPTLTPEQLRESDRINFKNATEAKGGEGVVLYDVMARYVVEGVILGQVFRWVVLSTENESPATPDPEWKKFDNFALLESPDCLSNLLDEKTLGKPIRDRRGLGSGLTIWEPRVRIDQLDATVYISGGKKVWPILTTNKVVYEGQTVDCPKDSHFKGLSAYNLAKAIGGIIRNAVDGLKDGLQGK